MKKFLIIVPLTPKRLLTPIRRKLFDIFLKNLSQIDYAHWEALLIGEEELEEGKIKYRKIGAESKELKLIYAREYIKSLAVKPDYVIRLDDDDLINPTLFSKLENKDFDCYADKYHVFYDVMSGKISKQERSWLANTVIHKYNHAIAEINEPGMTLLQSDHSKAWSEYYAGKNVIYAKNSHPVYMRILSPVTITSQAHNSSETIANQYSQLVKRLSNYESMSTREMEQYTNYLKGFGRWKNSSLPDFKESLIDLQPLKSTEASENKSGFINSLLGKILR